VQQSDGWAVLALGINRTKVQAPSLPQSRIIGEPNVQMIDELLCNASEAQLRNVLAMANVSEVELVALFEREAKMAAKESRRFGNVVPIR
jgi:hypothetical protein